ncbi:hypothetical protein M2150_001870 [Lachnospiraceae bacterium PM6-15]|uniref:hypothetical protein n=1 Tax=Ohessyouella blattaphilus TaxID=2949333 RepID=UPI003E1AF12C
MQKKVYKKWQIKKLVTWFLGIILCGGLFLQYATWTLYQDKVAEEKYWEKALLESPEDEEKVAALSQSATKVTVGTCVESLKEVNMKSSYYRVAFKVWFKWRGDKSLDLANNFHVYNGSMNKKEIITDETIDGVHYQLCSVDVNVFKNFWTKRFPLESHQLRFYIEPSYTIDEVVFEGDLDNCEINSSVSIAGYKLKRFANGVHTNEYESTYGMPDQEGGSYTSEFMTQMELNRSGFGLYLKCFIALFGTSLWVFIMVILCTYHRIDPLSMIPAALFGTVSNIMIGANLLPDALEIGLLEYVNAWGILTILCGALIIININRIRTKYNDNKFAALYGRILSMLLIFIVILGHIVMPIAAYL